MSSTILYNVRLTDDGVWCSSIWDARSEAQGSVPSWWRRAPQSPPDTHHQRSVCWSIIANHDISLLIASPAPLRYDVDLTPWSSPQEEPKVSPFIFNPSFFVEDAIRNYDLERTFEASSQHDNNDISLKDLDCGQPDSIPAESFLGKPNTHASETTTFVPPPSPLPPDVMKSTFDSIATDQENLRDARESLMGFRFRLRSKRRELKTAREEAGSKAGAAISLVKRFLQEQGIELPDDINFALSGVDALRDKLGTHEVDYEETEERYNQEEWKYTQKEEDLIEHLETYKPSIVAPSNQLVPENHGANPMLLGVDKIPRKGSGLSQQADLDDERGHEISNSHEDPIQDVTSMAKTQSLTESAIVAYDHLVPLGSGPTFEDPSAQWRSTRKRVNEWLLETVSLSSYQRQRLKDEQNWAQKVRHHWWLGSPHTSAFHTGDSTIESIETLPAPVVDSQWPQIGDSESYLDTRDLVDIPDAFIRQPSDTSPYLSVTPLKELEYPLERLAYQDQSLSLANPPSDNGVAELYSYGESQPRWTDAPSPSSLQDDAPDMPENQPDPTAARRNLPEGSSLALSCPPFAGESTLDSFPVVPVTSVRESSAREEDSQNRSRSQSGDCIIPQSSTPFIEIAGPRPWALPLVWLSFTARPKYLENIHVCNFVPFVSLPDTPFRLPGPSQFF